MTSFNTKVLGDQGLYRLEFETDDREQYLLMQKLARMCVDQSKCRDCSRKKYTFDKK